MEENKIKLVLDIFYTLNGQSLSTSNELPFEDVAILVLKENGQYESIKKNWRTQFHGTKESKIHDDQFNKQKKTVENLITDLKGDIRIKTPNLPTKGEGYSFSYDKTATEEMKNTSVIIRILPDEVKSILESASKDLGKKNVKNKIVEEGEVYAFRYDKTLTKEMKNISITCFDIFQKPLDTSVFIRRLPDNVKPALENAFIDLGKAILKKRIIEEVEKGAILNGEYKELLEFASVPEACRYFLGEGELGSQINNIKQKIKERALVFDKENQLIEDWSVINTRINAWVDHQRDKYL